MWSLQDLHKSEDVQEEARVKAIMQAYGTDQDEIDWSEQPCIIATDSGEILDGHHRFEAFTRLGYTMCRVLSVPEDFKLRAADIGLQAAVREAADDNDCPYTWSAA